MRVDDTLHSHALPNLGDRSDYTNLLGSLFVEAAMGIAQVLDALLIGAAVVGGLVLVVRLANRKKDRDK